MPDEVWEIFIKRRDLLKNLMDLAAEFLQEWFKQREAPN